MTARALTRSPDSTAAISSASRGPTMWPTTLTTPTAPIASSGRFIDVVAAVVGQVGAGEHPGDVAEVALGVLDRDDPRVLGERDQRLDLDRHDRRGGMS